MTKAVIMPSNKKETSIDDLKEIKYQNILGESISVTDFSEFSLDKVHGNLTFVGNSIFSIRSQDVVSIHFKND